MKYIVEIEKEKIVVEVTKSGQRYNFKLNGRPIDFDVIELSPDSLKSILVSGKSFEAELTERPGGLSVRLGGYHTVCRVEEERKARLARLAGEGEVLAEEKTLQAQMPGLVVEVLVSPGQEVKKDQGVIIVEAMKMQNELKASAEGRVKEIKVEKGETVEKDQILITFE